MDDSILNNQTGHQPDSPPPPPIIPPSFATPPPPPPPKKSGSAWKWILGLGCLGVMFLGAFVVIGAVSLAVKGERSKPFGPKVALINVSGVISSSGSGGIFGESGASSEAVIRNLRSAVKDSSVRAIVLRINSPGGSAAASQEIYNEVMRIRKTGIPIIASLGDVAASGGYYIASASNEIWATSGTLTGSIGVIISSVEMSRLFDKIGIKPEVVKSGKYKDMFSGNRPVTDEERAMAKEMIMDIYSQFVDDVFAGRNEMGLTREKLNSVADGRVMTGRQAKKHKLVDQIGGLNDALASAAKKAGISGEPNIWRVKRSFWETLAETKISINPQITISSGSVPGESPAQLDL